MAAGEEGVGGSRWVPSCKTILRWAGLGWAGLESRESSSGGGRSGGGNTGSSRHEGSEPRGIHQQRRQRRAGAAPAAGHTPRRQHGSPSRPLQSGMACRPAASRPRQPSLPVRRGMQGGQHPRALQHPQQPRVTQSNPAPTFFPASTIRSRVGNCPTTASMVSRCSQGGVRQVEDGAGVTLREAWCAGHLPGHRVGRAATAGQPSPPTRCDVRCRVLCTHLVAELMLGDHEHRALQHKAGRRVERGVCGCRPRGRDGGRARALQAPQLTM